MANLSDTELSFYIIELVRRSNDAELEQPVGGARVGHLLDVLILEHRGEPPNRIYKTS